MAGRNVTIGNVNIAMSANAAKMIQEVKKAESTFLKSFKNITKTLKTFMSASASAAKSMAKWGTIAGGVAVGMGYLGVQAYQAQRELQQMADVAGVSMQTFAKMTHITKSLGLETEYLSDGMKDLNVRIVDAAKGGGTMVDFFTLMGESAEEWSSLDPATQMDRFLGVLNKLGTNEARFWADEVNDSMYRLYTTMSRSGKTISDFMTEAEKFGAGTSAMLIHQVNDMFESFNRLKTIVTELAQTTLGTLAPALSMVFDSTAEWARDAVAGAGGASEGIFKVAQSISTSFLGVLRDMYVGFRAFVTQAMMIMGKFDDSFTIGLLKPDQQKALKEVNKQLEAAEKHLNEVADPTLWQTFKNFMTDGTSGHNSGDAVIDAQLAKIRELREQRTELLAGAADDPVVGKLDQMIAKVASQTLASLKSAPAGTKGSTLGIDPAEMKDAIALVKELNGVVGQQTDNQLKQLEIQKEKIKLLLDSYAITKQMEGTNAEGIVAAEKEAQKALDALEKQRQARVQQLADEKRQEQIRQNNEALQLHKEHLAARQQFDEQYRDTYGAMTEAQYTLEKIQMGEYLQQGLISHQEYADALVRLQEKKAHSEVASELTKLSVITNGMQAFFGESQTLARAGFAFTQGIALSETIMNQARAVSAAWADPTLPFYSKIGASVLAAAQVGQQIQTIKAAGQFHNGGQIPYDGTYYMEGGEMVIPKDTVRDFVDNTRSMGSSDSGGGVVIHSTINTGPSLIDKKVMAAALQQQQTTIAALVRKEQKHRPTR